VQLVLPLMRTCTHRADRANPRRSRISYQVPDSEKYSTKSRKGTGDETELKLRGSRLEGHHSN
jgi:hypothetical protein